MVLGLTGAWFTDRSGEKSANQTVKFGSVDIEMSVSSAVLHDNNSEAQFIYLEDANGKNYGDTGYVDTKEYHVVAGDKIVTTFTFENNSDVDIYYVIRHVKSDSSVEWLGLSSGVLAQIATAQDLNAGSNINAGTTTYTFAIPTSVQYNGEFQVDGHTVQAVRGATITLLNGTYELRAVQKANVASADAAFTLLTTAAEGTDWTTNANLYTAS